MARKRFVDPSFWVDPHIAKLSREERLMFLGCISAADDEGRLLGNPAYLRAQMFPYDEDLTVEDITKMRDRVLDLEKNLILYEIDGVEYMAFLKWSRYQKPSHPTSSRLPPPPGMNNSGDVPELLPKPSRNIPPQGRLGKDRLGKGSSRIGHVGQKNDDHQESQERTEREKTIAAYVKLYVASPPGVDVPYHLYPSEAMQDKVEEMADIWGDDVVQDAIAEAVNSGKPQLPPRYIESIIFRWKGDGRVKPRLTKEEYERLQAQRG